MNHKGLVFVVRNDGMASACSDCGRNFSTKRGLDTHRGKVHDPLPKAELVQLYCQEGLSSSEIAERKQMTHRAVKNRLTKHGVWGTRPLNFTLEPGDGYPVISRTGVCGKGRRIRVHRLVSIADGADPHKVFSGDYDIHHINGCPIDNRPDNLRLIDKATHGANDGYKSKRSYTHKDLLYMMELAFNASFFAD